MNNTALPLAGLSPKWTLHVARLSAAAASFASLLAASTLSLPWAHCVSIWVLSLLLWACVEVRAGEPAGSPTALDSTSFAAAAALFALSFFAMAWFAQPMTSLNGGMAWDGRNYFAMYGAFKGYQHGTIPAPYGQRVGLPMLATFLHFHADINFGVFECGFWLGAAALLAHCLRAQFRLSAPAALAVFAWAHLMFTSPARAAHFAPFTVEAPATFFFVLFLSLAQARKLTTEGKLCLCVCTGVAAAFFKETALLLALLGFASHAWTGWRSRQPAGSQPLIAARDARAPLHKRAGRALRAAFAAALRPSAFPWLGFALGAVAGTVLAQIPFGFWSGGANVMVMEVWIEKRSAHPDDFIRMVAAYALALGPFAMLAIARTALGEKLAPAMARRDAARSPLGARALWLLLALYALVSAFSGSDLTRFAFFALPLAAPLIVRWAGDVRPTVWLALLALSVPLARVFQAIPSPDSAEDPSRHHNEIKGLYSWFAEYATLHLVAASLAYVVAFGLLLAWAHRARRRRPAANVKQTA